MECFDVSQVYGSGFDEKISSSPTVHSSMTSKKYVLKHRSNVRSISIFFLFFSTFSTFSYVFYVFVLNEWFMQKCLIIFRGYRFYR
jgi:hypothetical protein